ncbi:fluoride efflux transporter CrcB [Paenibacillus provencensis]|uniref:Fluoride-specific ion channel FluC n=1 Tax=Paenibacillus provencensis TaxID=441151 RepID=A0ABW3PY54_9BACL|nr:fluoride efflux transporter CrcB [Paenibacillus sp. MER 78]MCM3129988.1 fluoride efflux transporter CrcB [Paenibacillus sp. MER 78]
MKELIYIGIGGFMGTAARYGVQDLFLPGEGLFTLAIWLINMAGCFFLGFFFTVTPAKWNIRPEIRLCIGTGFTGAFTTFSTFTVDVVRLAGMSELLLGLMYVTLSVVIGLFMSYLGIRLGQWMLGQAARKENTI